MTRLDAIIADLASFAGVVADQAAAGQLPSPAVIDLLNDRYRAWTAALTKEHTE